MTVAVGVTVRVDGARQFADLAMAAEQAELESIWRGEHHIRPLEGFSGYPYGSGDHLNRYAVLDPLQLSTAAAVVTERIVIGVGVLILPLWDPVTLARSMRTAALACDGRLAIGMGVGWSEPEFVLAQRAFRSRGTDTDRMIPLLARAMSTGYLQGPGGEGRLFDCDAGERETPPIELLIGGDSPAALRRAARFGGGWYGHHDDSVEQRIALLGGASDPPAGFTAGRRTVRIASGMPTSEILRLAEVGVERIIIPLVDDADPMLGIQRAADLRRDLATAP
jgi:alkanesulfonate monooxygenase SsuD/methylene tetrahydromethanopterin reductase-like flavin-dependent oxidoreductase (luciferase family)